MNSFKSWIEISRNSLEWNLSEVKRLVDTKVKILAIVKANAYGHGLKEVVGILKGKVDCFGVDNIDEALELRSFGMREQILVLGFIPISRLVEASDKNISVAFYNIEFFKEMVNFTFQKPLKIHLKIETGMNRQGIKNDELHKFIQELKKHSGKIVLEGVYTHFSDPQDIAFTDFQFSNFRDAIQILGSNGFKNLIRHVSASAGILIDKKYHLDMVRAGICLYGYTSYSSPKSAKKSLMVKPVLSWKSVVAQIKFIEKGEFIGYGRTWQAEEKTKIAIIPVGYFDGFDRRFSNNGEVLIKGKIAKVIGRVAMDMFTVDVSHIRNVNLADEATILNNADELAEKIGTITHEILSRINAQLPKVIT